MIPHQKIKFLLPVIFLNQNILNKVRINGQTLPNRRCKEIKLDILVSHFSLYVAAIIKRSLKRVEELTRYKVLKKSYWQKGHSSVFLIVGSLIWFIEWLTFFKTAFLIIHCNEIDQQTRFEIRIGLWTFEEIILSLVFFWMYWDWKSLDWSVAIWWTSQETNCTISREKIKENLLQKIKKQNLLKFFNFESINTVSNQL